MAGYATAGNASVIHGRSAESTGNGELGCRVAGLARHAGRQVSGRANWFSHWRDPGKDLAVMAVGTTADDTGVFHYCSAKSTWNSENCRRVAGLARQAGRKVIHRFGHWSNTGEDLPVVASRAAADDAGMVHHTRIKTGGAMTGRAHLCCGQMIRRHRRSSRSKQKTHRRSMAVFTW